MSDALTAPLEGGFLIRPRTVQEAMQLARFLSECDTLPKQFHGNPAAVLLVLDYGDRIGLPPLSALQGIAVVNGRFEPFGTAKLAVVEAHPDFVDMEETISDDGTTATCTIERRDRKPVTRTFTMALAQRMKLTERGGVWRTDPARMLQHRARGRAIADSFADALQGIGTDEAPPDYSVDVDVEALEATPAPAPALAPEPAPLALPPAPQPELRAESLPAAEKTVPTRQRTRRTHAEIAAAIKGDAESARKAAASRRAADARRAKAAAAKATPLPTPPPVTPPAPADERQQTLPHGPRLVPSPEALRRTLQDMRDADTVDELRRIALTACEGLDNRSPQHGSIVAQFHQCRSLLSAPQPQPSAPPSVTALQDRQRQRDDD